MTVPLKPCELKALNGNGTGTLRVACHQAQELFVASLESIKKRLSLNWFSDSVSESGHNL